MACASPAATRYPRCGGMSRTNSSNVLDPVTPARSYPAIIVSWYRSVASALFTGHSATLESPGRLDRAGGI